ncbi:MYSc [Nesidiocoris tenuis]|uniref:MYSc n=1 Tax=Nesidiocoris tenuis TaxID=355587 RepID=A0ABN7B2N9_9HEMI|nr:MYSc [Nesidiocoris tenuis]
MSTAEIYSKGARIWIPHPEKVWVGAKVVENVSNKELRVLTDDGELKELTVKSDDDLPPLRNPDILIGQNDLTSLSYLHEPAVLHNLQVRFCKSNYIYTYCGIVLVAINPYCEVSIYDPETIWMYRGMSMGELDPHIFAVAEEAYTKIEREQMNQSIIVSGESGAGKTVSAKYAMRYFATVGGSSTETQVEKKVLASSPIMEAIGNAKTIRNDNSSRFGKYIELHFSKNYTIIGASMSTYLLEKSRVVFQATGERNYHIFYQMCAARKKLPHLFIEDATAYNYLCDPDTQIAGVNDEAQFLETYNALVTLGFSEKTIDDLLTILASVLHLGNVAIPDNEVAVISSNDVHLSHFANLLAIDANELRRWLCNRKIVSMRESINKQLSAAEARQARDALAKHIYACLFIWIVSHINRELITSTEAKHRFIGVLDIYGFETFEVNSFEQFCINYANEKLQQQFNMHVFKLEQDEYLKEGIEWKFIDFYDNQPCIDLIETKLGILDLLDEECRMPKGSDNSWAEKLYLKCTKWTHFSKPRFGNSSFLLKHFADRVEYDVSGFLEKNRDTVIEEQVTVLKSSQNKLIQRLFNEDASDDDGKLAVPKPKVRISLQQKAPPQNPPASSVKNKKTVGSQFRDSLAALMKTLNSTTPHYIRCIKPNDDKTAFSYNPSRAVQQLRACGVLETIRISAAGFPSRLQYGDFLKRYRALAHSKEVNWDDLQSTCTAVLSRSIQGVDKFKFGKTKLFFRAGQVAHLEKLRSEKLLKCCIVIQKAVRGFLVRRRYTRTLKATNTLQRYFRGYLARRRVEGMRRNRAAVKIQTCVRRWVKQTQYERTRRTVLGLQRYARGHLARLKFQEMRRNRAAVVIQTAVRGWLCRVRYRKERHRVIICQSAIRRFLARRRFRKMKREARSAEHLKKLNKGLENKIISLQQKNSELTKELNQKKNLVAELDEARVRLGELKQLEASLKTLKQEKNSADNIIAELKAENKNFKEIVAIKEEGLALLKKNEAEILQENERFRAEIVKLESVVDSIKTQKEEEFEQRLKSELKQLIDERNEERAAHQKLLAEKDVLESRIDVLERTSGKHKRSSSDASTVSVQDEDNGYGSVKSSNSVRDGTPTPEQQVDVNLVMKLQQKLKALERENYMLHCKVEKDDKFQIGPNNYKVEEMEVEISRLKNDLNLIREAVAADERTGGKSSLKELTRQAEFWEEEANRAREEAAALREALGQKTSSASSLARSSYPNIDVSASSLINEDGELILAFEAQKKTLRQLESERQNDLMRWNIEREELVGELERVRAELERLRDIVAGNLDPNSSTKAEAFLRSEVTRLTAEYLELQEKHDAKSIKLRKISEQNKELLRKLKDAGIAVEQQEDESAVAHKQLTTQASLPVIKKKERDEYMGMFEISSEEIEVFMRHLLELSPKIAITLLPGLPAYIIFMCIRYYDYQNDDSALHLTILAYTKKVTKLLKRKSNDIDCGILWLANTLRLLHNLKQYSGEIHFGKENTHKQNEQCLRNFDLSELRQLLSDKAIQICQGILKSMCEILQPLVVSAILEHEAIPGLSRPRSSSVATDARQPLKKESMDQLLDLLSLFNRTLNLHGVDPQLITLFFMQIFYFLCANSLNNLMLRRDYCHWSKGMQMRYNLSYLEQWVREEKIQDPRVVEMLHPVIQAAQLLQGRKWEEDVDKLIDMCSKLTSNQIVKLLHLYSAHNTYEDSVSPAFLQKMQTRLKELRPNSADNALMMDVHKSLPLEFPFNPSSIRLEDIEIPDILNLPMLKKL